MDAAHTEQRQAEQQAESTPPTTPDLPSTYACPITAFTGFLGAGKTTIILSLIQQLNSSQPAPAAGHPPIVWLKNEFGDTQTDSLLARQLGIRTQQLTNGCICCTATGQLHDTLAQLTAAYQPARILIETTGSSSPVALALALKAFSRQQPGVYLDSIVCVVDVEQCSRADSRGSSGLGGGRAEVRYNDLVVLNKCEAVSERELDDVVDAVAGVTEGHVAVVKSVKGWVDARLVLGVRGSWQLEDVAGKERRDETAAGTEGGREHWAEIGVVCVASESKVWREEELLRWLAGVRRDEVYRVKGPVHIIPAAQSTLPQQPPSHPQPSPHPQPHPHDHAHSDSHPHHNHSHSPTHDHPTPTPPPPQAASTSAPACLLNWAYGRHTLTALSSGVYSGGSRLTLMGHPSIEQAVEMGRLRRGLGLGEADRVYVASKRLQDW